MKREQFISAVFLVVLVYVAWQIFSIFSVFSSAILGAAVLAFLFYPIQKRLEKGLRSNTLTAVLMTALIFFVVFPPMLLLIFSLSTQIIDLSQAALKFVQEGGVEKLIHDIQNHPWFQSMQHQTTDWELLQKNLSGWILGAAKNLGNATAGKLGVLTKNLFFIGLNVFFMFILVFIFLKDGNKIYAFIYQSAPFEEKTKRTIFDEITGTFEAVIRGQVLAALAQALVATVLYASLGIHAFLFFGVLTFIMALVPVGAAAVWLPLVVWFFMTGKISQGWIMLIAGIGISFIDNFIKPLIIGERTKLPYFVLFFGIAGGIVVYGFSGVFIAPVVLALFFALVKIYREEYLHAHSTHYPHSKR